VSARHTVEIHTATELREGDEILSRQFEPVRIAKVEHYPGSVFLYDREGPSKHTLGQFGHTELFAVLVRSAEEPTDAEVERGARALWQEAEATDEHGDWNPWDKLYDSEKEQLRREARAVLQAARDDTDGTAVSLGDSGAAATDRVRVTDLEEKPEIVVQSDQPPSYQLELEDIVDGNGKEAVSGQLVEIHYVGVGWQTGKQFDASWDRGKTFKFTLGEGQVIAGWDQGVAGMRVGGRRRITIPPSLAYGQRGAHGVIGPDETLVFVVDLIAVS